MLYPLSYGGGAGAIGGRKPPAGRPRIGRAVLGGLLRPFRWRIGSPPISGAFQRALALEPARELEAYAASGSARCRWPRCNARELTVSREAEEVHPVTALVPMGRGGQRGRGIRPRGGADDGRARCVTPISQPGTPTRALTALSGVVQVLVRTEPVAGAINFGCTFRRCDRPSRPNLECDRLCRPNVESNSSPLLRRWPNSRRIGTSKPQRVHAVRDDLEMRRVLDTIVRRWTRLVPTTYTSAAALRARRAKLHREHIVPVRVLVDRMIMDPTECRALLERAVIIASVTEAEHRQLGGIWRDHETCTAGCSRGKSRGC